MSPRIKIDVSANRPLSQESGAFPANLARCGLANDFDNCVEAQELVYLELIEPVGIRDSGREFDGERTQSNILEDTNSCAAERDSGSLVENVAFDKRRLS